MTQHPFLRYVPWAALGLFFVMGLVGDKGVMRWWQVRQEAAVLERQLSEARAEGKQLTWEVHALRGDRRYIEKTAREDLGMLRPNEVMYRFEE